MKLDKTPLKMEFLRRILKFVRETMRDQGIDTWITFSREGNEDPLAQNLRFSDLTWRSAAIIEQDGKKTAFVGDLDVDAVKQAKFYDDLFVYGSEGVTPKLRQDVGKSKPKKIAVKTSFEGTIPIVNLLGSLHKLSVP